MGQRWSRALAVAAALVFAAALLVGPAPSAVAEPAAPPPRILIVGDSIAQGSAGDYTWRYRLWRHLLGAGAPVDFVGPQRDLFDHTRSGDVRADRSPAYADLDFDLDHAARWGMTLAFPDRPIADLVTAFEPDVVLLALGVNDLIGLRHSPQRVVDDLRAAMGQARSARPGVAVVVGELAQPWHPVVAETTRLIAEQIPELSTDEAPVRVARMPADLTVEQTWDGGHPDAQGEVMIAAGFADALATLGIGAAAPRPAPSVPLGPRTPPSVTAARSTSDPTTAEVAWSEVPGATSYRVQVAEPNGRWHLAVETSVTPTARGTSARLTSLAADRDLLVSVQPVKGRRAAEPDAWSTPVVLPAVVRTPPRLALPARPPSLHAHDRGRRIQATWTAVRGAAGYRVEWSRGARPSRVGSREVSHPRAVTPRLPPGRYRLTVRALGDDGRAGPPRAVAVRVRR